MGKSKGKYQPWYESIQRKTKSYVDDIHRMFSPHTFVEQELLRLDKLNEDQRLYYKELQQYLADEREKRIEDIKNSIASFKKTDETFHFSRIVTSKFANDPFNGAGSVMKPPGGRFNIGRSVSYNNYFMGLYFASSFDTAFAEKYQDIEEGTNKEDLLDFSLRGPDSFSYCRSKITLESYFDLTQEGSLNEFYDVIKDITVPDYIKNNAKKVHMSANLVSDSAHLRKALLDPKYTQSGTWLDQPSPSQWFGHYVRLSGVQGILYPSVRYENGVNLVVFPENIAETSASILFVDEMPNVPVERAFIDKTNFQNFIHLA